MVPGDAATATSTSAGDQTTPDLAPARAVTIYDVARAAGVSHQTIANVLKFPQRVAPATRDRVRRHIAELGFRPNRTAQNLGRRRSGLIGFRVSPRNTLATGGILDTFLHSIAEAAEAVDHHVVLFHGTDGVAEVDKAVELFQRNAADAFVVANTFAGDERIPAYLRSGLRFVTFGRTGHGDAHGWVDTDNVAGAQLATEHLLALGHRDIGFLGWPDHSLVGSDRLDGWRATLRRARCRHGEALVARSVNDRQSAAAATTDLLARHPDLTALVAASDELAVGALASAADAGRALSVVGYDDSPLATIGAGLTTISQPIAAIATEIMRITAALIDGQPAGSAQLLVRPELVVRASTRPPVL